MCSLCFLDQSHLMAASWKPSLRQKEISAEVATIATGSGNVLPEINTPPGLELPQQTQRTGRKWKSAKTTKPAAEEGTTTTLATVSYGRESLLLVRQQMLEKFMLPSVAKRADLASASAADLQSSSPAQKPSMSSSCSTVDTLSDVSDEHDPTSCSFEKSADEVGAPLGQFSSLRANAVDFVPGADAVDFLIGADMFGATAEMFSVENQWLQSDPYSYMDSHMFDYHGDVALDPTWMDVPQIAQPSYHIQSSDPGASWNLLSTAPIPAM